MDRARTFQHLEFRDPRPFLVRLREVEPQVANSDLPSRALREGALFCYGMAQRIGQTVYLAPSEAQDYDFVASWIVGDTQHLAPAQLKEVPQILNSTPSVQERVNALAKYVDSEDLTVVIHLNQRVHFHPAQLVVPPMKIAALWVFGAISPDKEQWGLWGDFLETPEATRFEYPT